MDAISFSPGFRFPYLSTSRKLNLREVADGPFRLSFKKDLTRMLSLTTSRNRRENRSRDIRVLVKSSKGEISKPSDDAKSSNQEEIIALFRRIQSSISKGNNISTPPKRRSASNPSRDNYKPSTESVLEVLRQSRKQVKGESSSKKGVNKEFVQKEEIEQENHPVTDFNKSRPPSNFVKRSPVPSPSISREKVVEHGNATVGAESRSKKIEEMKVSELKELAKSRGIKGYSKLKKDELIEWLRSSEN